MNGKSPHEVLFNKQPTIGHLKIFGCPAYPLELNNKGDKFESVAQENCIMVGYDDESGIYFIYNKYTKKVFRSRDVRFNEEPLLQEKQSENIEIAICEIDTKYSEEDDTIGNEVENENLQIKTERKNKQIDFDDTKLYSREKDDVEYINTNDQIDNNKIESNKENINNIKRIRKQTQFNKSGESITQTNKALINTLNSENYFEPLTFVYALMINTKRVGKML